MSVIRIEQPKHIAGTAQARQDWAEATGRELTLKPAVFLHEPTGEYYCHIVGGIGYPCAVPGEVKPGIVIIMGVQNEPLVKFRVLETWEDANVFKLIEKAIEAREKYGYGQDSRILPNFYGDQERYQSLIVQTSEMLESKLGHERGLYIKDTVDLRIPHSFPLYVRQIFNTLETKRLDIKGDRILTGHLQGFQREDAERGKTEHFPGVGLLGGMVHSLQIERPWLEMTDDHGTAFNLEF